VPQIILRKKQDDTQTLSVQQTTYGADVVHINCQDSDTFTVYEIIDDDLVCVGKISQDEDSRFVYTYAIDGEFTDDSWEVPLQTVKDADDET
jgi:hypothetical protein